MSSTSEAPPRTRIPVEAWALIAALPLGQVANVALSPVVPAMRQDLQLSYADLGLVLSSFGVARLLMDLPTGPLLGRVHPRLALLASLGVILAASAIGLFAFSPWQVAVARFLHGGASAVVQAVVLGWLVGGSSPALRGRVMALSEAAFSVVSFLSPLLSGALATTIGWRSAFLFGVVCTLAGLAVVQWLTHADSAARAFGLHERVLHADRPAQLSLLQVTRLGGRFLLAGYVLAFLIFYNRSALIITLLPLLGGDSVGLSTLGVGIAQSLLNVVSIGTLLVGGWLGDRLGRRRLILPGALVILGCQAAVLFVTNEPSYMLVSVLQGAVYFPNSVPTSMIGDALPASARSRGITLYRFIADGAILVAPILVGVGLQLGGFGGGLLTTVVPSLLMTGALLWLLRGRGVVPVATAASS